MKAVNHLLPPAPKLNVRAYLRDLRYHFATTWRQGCDRLKWLGHKPNNLEIHAERELRLAGWFDTDGFYSDMLGHAVLRMVREFADEGHSGMSAGLAVSLFKEVASYKPLTPLTGEDHEWGPPSEFVSSGARQNKRCSHVFKDADGRAYDIGGRVFREPSGTCYTSQDSRVYVEFPYTPKTEYVDVPVSDEEAGQ